MKTTILALAVTAQLLGCGAWTVTTPPLATVELTAAPIADIDVYPSTVYDGRTVYFYDNRWYYRDGARWRYYDQEPAGLAARRYDLMAQPVPYVDIGAPPVVNIERYPSAIYGGRPAYFYNNRWYYREGSRWRYYRYEPQPLTERRHQMHGQPPTRPYPQQHYQPPREPNRDQREHYRY